MLPGTGGSQSLMVQKKKKKSWDVYLCGSQVLGWDDVLDILCLDERLIRAGKLAVDSGSAENDRGRLDKYSGSHRGSVNSSERSRSQCFLGL